MIKQQANITILCLGSELIDGNILDTNSKFIAEILKKHGFQARKVVKIPDDEKIILKTLGQEFEDSNLIISTGGLGPTFDDITIQTLAKYFDRELTFNRFAYESIAYYFKSKNRKIKKRHRLQAYLPKGCKIVVNRVGVCPALFLSDGKRSLLAMPGVPAEMEGMFESSVIPFFKKHYKRKMIYERMVRTAGAPEIMVERKVSPLIKKYRKKGFEFGIYPHTAAVSIKVKGTVREKVQKVCKELAKKSGKYFYGFDNDTLAAVVAKSLKKKKRTISIAESCTGGWVAKTLTDIPGISKCFLGGCIVYQNKVKEKILGISSRVLRENGAVSIQAAKQLANNVREKFGTDYGLAVTGIAGPTGGTQGKPVGLVYLGIASPKQTKAWKFQFTGDRNTVRQKTVNLALFHLMEALRGKNK